MNIFRKKQEPTDAVVQTARQTTTLIPFQTGNNSIAPQQLRLYDTIRNGIPIIDAALLKIIRLIGGYTFTCTDKAAEAALNHFALRVKVGNNLIGMESFICGYLDSLLLYGNACGEIVLDNDGRTVVGLYNANLEDIELQQGKTAMDINVFAKSQGGQLIPVKNKSLILFTALNPKPSQLYGNSLLNSLPFVSLTLLKIFESMAQNFERMGNLRYAVTYKPSNDSVDKAYAKERAMQIAKEWSDGMAATKNGQVTDFISVGDVSIKVIGADNQLIDTNIPVRQLLEQIVAKLGIPPFLLGLAWSSTERMSKQQSDILTSELEYYRRLLTPVIIKIATTFLRFEGFSCDPEIVWDFINLQDEAELARASLYTAQAHQLEPNNKEETT